MRTVAEIVEAIHRLSLGAPESRPPNLPPGANTAGQPEWYKFEHTAWSVGERVRQALASTPKLRCAPEVVEALAEAVECESLRRGRQPFLLCLAFVGAQSVAGRVVPYLKDEDVQGHVLHALLGMRISGYAADVAPLKNATHAWVKRLARKYIERYPAEPAPFYMDHPNA